jgi:hypothetical protein
MAAPKHNINIMFLETACSALKNNSPLLYLPIRKTKKYFQHFPGVSRKRHLYVRASLFPQSMRDFLQPLFDKMQILSYLFITADTGSRDFLDHINLEQLRSLIFQCTDRQHLLKWIRLVKKSKKQWIENHPVLGKYLLFCSFLLAHAFSERDLKLQFRLVSS